jgi:crossover junction endodeoxyribonuclease RuvC
VVATLGIPHTLVHPATWKAQIKLTGPGKNVYRAHAQRLYPQAPLGRVMDHNRAEALLIAKYGHGLLA